MSYQFTREEHSLFYERELSAQTDSFKQVLGTSALYLLQEKEELFVAQFVTFRNGEMILKFSNNRMFPRIAEYLYCFLVTKDFRNYKIWGNISYQELLSKSVLGTEVQCIWAANSNEEGYSLIGFRGMSLDFVDSVRNAGKFILFLGPNPPPFEYLLNLQKLVTTFNNSHIKSLLDVPLSDIPRLPNYLNSGSNVAEIILEQSKLEDVVIIQGPPGTGKTHLIGELCSKLCLEGKSVLVTSLTNRALIELSHKTPLQELINQGKVFKKNLSFDEHLETPNLKELKNLQPINSSLILSTFFCSSIAASSLLENADSIFDYVIVDEASQAFLATLGIAKLLGRKNIWIGDIIQLPPVTAINSDIVKRRNFNYFIEGLKIECSELTSYPYFALTKSHRLTNRAASYTAIFYNNSLVSENELSENWSLLDEEISRLFHQKGGPTLIKLPLSKGVFDDRVLIKFAAYLSYYVTKSYPDRHISILCQSKVTVKATQKAITSILGKTTNILIDTVARAQGLTTDLTIYLIPDASYHRSLNSNLFNVATSRSRMNTIILCSKELFQYNRISETTSEYIRRLNAEFSFDYSKKINDLSDGKILQI